MPVLTLAQRSAIETLEWLYDPADGHRRQGRTTATAIALIRIALRYPGFDIEIRDHHASPGPGRRSTEEITRIIVSMLDGDPVLRSAYLIRRGRLTFNGEELAPLVFDHWLPQGWAASAPGPHGPSHAPGRPVSVTTRNLAANLTINGDNLSNAPPPRDEPEPPETPQPETTLWDYVEDPTF
jgi:hypothetical protein